MKLITEITDKEILGTDGLSSPPRGGLSDEQITAIENYICK